MDKLKECFARLSKQTKYLIRGSAIAAMLVIVLLAVFSGSGDISVSVEASLKEMIVTSKLRTAEYTYNSIADIMDGGKIKYHVSYKGTVTAGFDFENVEVVRNGNTIKVILPDVKILEVIVDPELDYIFVKEKYDTENTYAEATAACKQDLLEKAQANETLLKFARESAEDTLNALMKPFESQLREGESFEIVFSSEEEVDAK